MSNLVKIPTLAELVADTDEKYNETALTVILNSTPPEKWLKEHPLAKIKNSQGQSVPLPYLPIDKVEYLLTKIYGRWWVEVLDTKTIANSVAVTVRLFVKNPLTGEAEWNDGVGATPIQTDAGAGAMDWNKAKSSGVQIALPSAETYAIKDAAEKFGKLFGKDLGRRDTMDYSSLLKPKFATDFDELKELFELKKHALSDKEKEDGERILEYKENSSYSKLKAKLIAL